MRKVSCLACALSPLILWITGTTRDLRTGQALERGVSGVRPGNRATRYALHGAARRGGPSCGRGSSAAPAAPGASRGGQRRRAHHAAAHKGRPGGVPGIGVQAAGPMAVRDGAGECGEPGRARAAAAAGASAACFYACSGLAGPHSAACATLSPDVSRIGTEHEKLGYNVADKRRLTYEQVGAAPALRPAGARPRGMGCSRRWTGACCWLPLAGQAERASWRAGAAGCRRCAVPCTAACPRLIAPPQIATLLRAIQERFGWEPIIEDGNIIGLTQARWLGMRCCMERQGPYARCSELHAAAAEAVAADVCYAADADAAAAGPLLAADHCLPAARAGLLCLLCAGRPERDAGAGRPV